MTGVELGGIADGAGIKQGDVVKEINRQKIASLSDYRNAMRQRKEGEPLLLLLKRGKQSFFVSLEAHLR